MEKESHSLLIIFYRNPVQGKVKTRLAATLGGGRALDIYRRLAGHIRDISRNLNVHKVVFYSDAVETDDLWPPETYRKAVQRGIDLGERMKHAFSESLQQGYTSVVLIGTDCYELTSAVLEEAFRALQRADAVIGKAKDGGYYLLGMKRMYNVFEGKRWSTETVYEDTMADFRALGIRVAMLPVLQDVDREEDLPPGWKD